MPTSASNALLWLGLSAAAAVAQPVDTAEAMFEELRATHSTMGTCVAEFGEDHLSTAEECEASGRLWYSALPSLAAFEAAVALEDPETSLYLAALPLEAAVEADLGALGVIPGPRALIVTLPGPPPPSAGATFAVPMPRALKRAPMLAIAAQEDALGARRLAPGSPHAHELVVQLRTGADLQATSERLQVEYAARAQKRRQLQGTADGVEVTFAVPAGINRPSGNTAGRGAATTEANLLVVSGVVSAAQAEAAIAVVEADIDTLWVEPGVEMEFTNADAASLMQSGYQGTSAQAGTSLAAENMPIWDQGVLGQGEVVGIGDSGLEVESCLFEDPAVDDGANTAARAQRPAGTVFNYETHRKVIQYTTFRDHLEGTVQGHGTHVAGSVAGSPALSSDQIIFGGKRWSADEFNGMAPAAKIAFLDVGDVDIERSVFTPQNAEGLVGPAYDVGARIHTNSWGGSQNVYTSMAQSLDYYMWQKQDMLVLFAAGNAGENGAGLGSPATGKNLIAVGAEQNADRSWRQVGRSCDKTSSGPGLRCSENMAYFSSKGPTSDGRIKPDLVAPGYWITSARSSGGSSRTCAVFPTAGTSMATPVLAGTSALVRQWFREGRYPSGVQNQADAIEPLGALVKAMLVHAAKPLEGRSLNRQLTGRPDSHQGWGRPTIANALRRSEEGAIFIKAFGDMRTGPPVFPQGATPSNTQSWSFNVQIDAPGARAAQRRLRATLVYHDYPNQLSSRSPLVNDLDLEVVTPRGTVLFPNGRTSRDATNNVEQVDVAPDSLESGVYVVRIIPRRVSVGPQPFAVVISGYGTTTTGPPQQTESPTGSPVVRPADPTSSPTGSPVVRPADPTSSPTGSPVVGPVDSTLSPSAAPSSGNTTNGTTTWTPTATPTQGVSLGDEKEDNSTMLAILGAASGVLLVTLLGGAAVFVWRRRSLAKNKVALGGMNAKVAAYGGQSQYPQPQWQPPQGHPARMPF